MYLAARSWGLPPSEFWAMTLSEFTLEAAQRIEDTPEGRALKNKAKWVAGLDMSAEEWKAKYG